MSTFSKLATSILIAIAACTPLAGQGALSTILQQSANTPAKTSTDQLGRDTPYGTIYGFLQAAQAGQYSIASQYLQMSPRTRQSEGDTLAMKLFAVMNSAFAGNLRPSRQAEGTLQEDVPPGRQRLGTMSAGDVEDELELVRVTDPTAGKIWLISSDTLGKVPELYDQVGARKVETKLPAWAVKHQFAGMPLWQWFALLLMVPIAAVAAWVLLVILQVPMGVWARRHGNVDRMQWRSVSGPAWLLVGTLIHRILASYLGMPLLQRHYYVQITAVAVIIGANWILWRVIRWFLRGVRNRALAHGHSGTGSLMLLGERIVKAMVVVMALFLVFSVLGFDMSKALAGVGIGALAIGFGAQQTIANLFGGVSVLGDEVIHVGDVCKFGDRTGTVEDIGLRSTRVRTEERTLLAIPNGTVATINVENLSRRDKLLFKTVLGFHLDTTSDELRNALTEIRGVLTGAEKVEKSSARVRLLEVTQASINVEVVCYVLTQDFDTFAEVREGLLLKIMKYVEESPANLAKPSQMLYLNQGDETVKDKIKAGAEKADEQKPVTKNSGNPA